MDKTNRALRATAIILGVDNLEIYSYASGAPLPPHPVERFCRIVHKPTGLRAWSEKAKTLNENIVYACTLIVYAVRSKSVGWVERLDGAYGVDYIVNPHRT